MGGVNPLLAALLDLIGIDVYDSELYKFNSQQSGTFGYQGKSVEYRVFISQLGNSLFICGMIGDDVIDLKVLKPGVALLVIQHPDPTLRLSLSFECGDEKALYEEWKAIEPLFLYAK